MTIIYLNYMKKWLAKYQGKAVGVGDTIGEAIAEGYEVIINSKKKFN